MEIFETNFGNKLKDFGVPSRVINASKEYADKVSKSILDWASKTCTAKQELFPNIVY